MRLYHLIHVVVQALGHSETIIDATHEAILIQSMAPYYRL